ARSTTYRDATPSGTSRCHTRRPAAASTHMTAPVGRAELAVRPPSPTLKNTRSSATTAPNVFSSIGTRHTAAPVAESRQNISFARYFASHAPYLPPYTR